MNKEEKPQLKQQIQTFIKKGLGLNKYLWLVFIVLIALIYGYVLIKINGFLNTAPSSSAIAKNLKTSDSPVINQNVVNELSQLQNNSVSVQSLFNQTRSNPFQ
ncbi:MAG: hypothetical protein ACREF7_00630 [Candidatus Saccharimonadales bacterium]